MYDPSPVVLPGYRPEYQVARSEIEHAISMIAAAERPIVFCGHGVIWSGATKALLELVEKADIPVACTLLGLGGFPASHARALGMMGMHGEAWVNKAIQESDLVIAIGMRFDDRVTGNLKTYTPHAKKIHIELDPAEVNKNVKVDLALVGDACEILNQLVPNVRRGRVDAWLGRIAALRGDTAVLDIKDLP